MNFLTYYHSFHCNNTAVLVASYNFLYTNIIMMMMMMNINLGLYSTKVIAREYVEFHTHGAPTETR